MINFHLHGWKVADLVLNMAIVFVLTVDYHKKNVDNKSRKIRSKGSMFRF